MAAPLTERIQRYLLMADIAVDARFYVTTVGVAALVITILLVLAGLPIGAAGIAYLLLLAAGLYLPRLLARWRAERAEAELPSLLMTVASLVDAGVDFPTALESVSGRGVLGKAVSHALSVYRRGVPMERALRRVGESFLSEDVRRAFDHLAVLYHSGAETTVIKRLAEDRIRIQEYEARRFTAKLAMYTLIYVAVAALVPSLYAMYVMLSSFALGVGTPVSNVYMIVFGAFPAATAATLAYMYVKMPAFMRG